MDERATATASTADFSQAHQLDTELLRATINLHEAALASRSKQRTATLAKLLPYFYRLMCREVAPHEMRPHLVRDEVTDTLGELAGQPSKSATIRAVRYAWKVYCAIWHPDGLPLTSIAELSDTDARRGLKSLNGQTCRALLQKLPVPNYDDELDEMEGELCDARQHVRRRKQETADVNRAHVTNMPLAEVVAAATAVNAAHGISAAQQQDSGRRRSRGKPAVEPASLDEDSASVGQEIVVICADRTCFLSGLGESGHVPKCKGLHDIFELTQTPHQPVPMRKLLGIGLERATDQRTHQPAIDAQARREARDELLAIKGKMERAREDHDYAEADTLQEEYDELLAHHTAALGLRGKSRDLNNPVDKWRPTIHNRLRTAYRRLREAKMPQLADHFEARISADGSSFVYRPIRALSGETVAEK
jgi:hypothetical protein